MELPTYSKSKTTFPQLLKLATAILDESKRLNGHISRMEELDKAYARYIDPADRSDREKVGSKVCGQVINSVVNPIVISQVNSLVAFWAETFLTGYPIFGVVSPPDQKEDAMALEGIIQDHMAISQSVPELMKLFYDGAKYNIMAWRVNWEPIKVYDPVKEMTDLTDSASTRVKVDNKHINVVKRLDFRNVHWDRTVPLTEADARGRFIGYTELVNGTELVERLQYLEDEGTLAGQQGAIAAKLKSSARDAGDYVEPTDWTGAFATHHKNSDETDWGAIFAGPDSQRPSAVLEASNKLYNLTTLYVRIRPMDYGIKSAGPNNRFQIWKMQLVNRDTIIYMQPFIGAYGRFPIGLAHAIEDGLDLQTQSYGEMAVPLQDATTRIMTMRLDAAKRAIQDRGLYNPKMIKPEHINSPIPAAKIPVVPSALSESGLDQAYRPIPYDARGTESLIQDAVQLENWQKELSGINSATKGQFTKGNRTLGEFDTIMGNAESRLRLPNIVIEHRMMSKIKEAIKLNLLMYGEDTVIISPRTGEPIELSIQNLQQHRMEFEVADGYMPKGKMVNTEFLVEIMHMITQSPILQQELGYQLPSILSHVAQLAGVRGFDRYALAAEKDAAHNIRGVMAVQQAIMTAVQEIQGQLGIPPMEAPPEAQPPEGQPNQEMM